MGTIKTDRLSGFAWQCHERNAARRAVEGSKRGFTLMELMVYIAIMGIVVIVAGQAFSNSAKSRIRTQSMLKASEVAENVATLFKQDVAQTGAKSSVETGSIVGGDNFSAIKSRVYMNPKSAGDPDDKVEDLSSFKITTQEDGNSDLKVRRVRYDDNGHYKAVEEVRWFVVDDTLKRSCWTVDSDEGGVVDADNCSSTSADGAVAVDIASGVSQFIVKPAKPGVTSGKEQVFPLCGETSCSSEFRMVPRKDETDYVEPTIVHAADHKSVVLSGFKTNYDKNGNNENKDGQIKSQVLARINEDPIGSQWKNLCTKIPLEKDVEYELSFSIADGGSTEKTRMFVPGRDYLAVGFRSTKNGNKPPEVDDFLFYPPMESTGAGKRTMRFSVGNEVKNVCIAFTFASYSPIAAEGNITISDLMLKKVGSSNYNFDYEGEPNIPDSDMKNVKALRLDLVVKKNGEGGEVSLVVPIPSNGPTD